MYLLRCIIVALYTRCITYSLYTLQPSCIADFLHCRLSAFLTHCSAYCLHCRFLELYNFCIADFLHCWLSALKTFCIADFLHCRLSALLTFYFEDFLYLWLFALQTLSIADFLHWLYIAIDWQRDIFLMQIDFFLKIKIIKYKKKMFNNFNNVFIICSEFGLEKKKITQNMNSSCKALMKIRNCVKNRFSFFGNCVSTLKKT